jgi:hypothetical protein
MLSEIFLGKKKRLLTQKRKKRKRRAGRVMYIYNFMKKISKSYGAS